MTLGNHFLCSYLVHHLEFFSENVLKLKTTPAGSKCSRQRSTFWRPLPRERATVDIRTWSRHTVWIWVEIHFRTELMIFCNFLIANIEIGQPSKSTLGGSWKWCSERTRPSCPRRGKDNCGFQSRIKIFCTFSKKLLKNKPSDLCKVCSQRRLLLWLWYIWSTCCWWKHLSLSKSSYPPELGFNVPPASLAYLNIQFKWII